MSTATAATQRTGVVNVEGCVGERHEGDAKLRAYISEGLRLDLINRVTAMIDDGRTYVVKVEPERAVEVDVNWGAIAVALRRRAIVALHRPEDAEVGELVAHLPGDHPSEADVVYVADGRAFRRVRGLWERVG
jgi:hypothetical protein